ncbi:hypothetical protein L596_023725 [Steinernema carpocapsae]|uniref:Uncharacterized protein n=1 Tax=Steinernema carpocapsae TaxID=34508 RepID=A0A4U5MEI3_STECR|nr:hypothetical protein L596_023725 [Steinernema carpocapsae]
MERNGSRKRPITPSVEGLQASETQNRGYRPIEYQTFRLCFVQLLVVKAVMKKGTFHYSDFHTIEQMKADWSIVEETQWNTIVNEVRSKIPASECWHILL